MKSKNMKGFMCHSPSATAVCMATEPLSVIVPRRPDYKLVDPKLMNNSKYIRLGERPNSAQRKVTSSDSATKSSSCAAVSSVPPPVKIDQEKGPQDLASFDANNQVVVMRVSLHCKGCAGKVEKHLSKMEGVTSFTIELESKRVTVKGHVSPMGLLDSISKIKRAELWPCPK